MVTSRPLQGLAVGVSISGSEDSSALGFPSAQVNRVTVQIASALLGQGAAVVFGHDWREDGVMDAIYRFAIQFEAPSSGDGDGEPLIRNMLPWPDQPSLSENQQERLGSILKIEPGKLPDELQERWDSLARDPERAERYFPYFRARGLTYLRHRLNDVIDGRVCFGGPKRGYQGRYPGIVEEALFAVQNRTPLYLAGLFGGATQQIIDAFGRVGVEDSYRSESAPALYAAGSEFERNNVDRQIDPRGVWLTFAEMGLSGLSTINGLSQEENQALFRAPALDQAISLILTGLARVHGKKSGGSDHGGRRNGRDQRA